MSNPERQIRLIGLRRERDRFQAEIDKLERLEGMKPTCPNCGHEPCAEWCTSKAAPVDGVVPGSNLERQIQLARQTIAGWPPDVKAALVVERCECAEPKKSTKGDWCTLCFRQTGLNRGVTHE